MQFLYASCQQCASKSRKRIVSYQEERGTHAASVDRFLSKIKRLDRIDRSTFLQGSISARLQRGIFVATENARMAVTSWKKNITCWSNSLPLLSSKLSARWWDRRGESRDSAHFTQLREMLEESMINPTRYAQWRDSSRRACEIWRRLLRTSRIFVTCTWSFVHELCKTGGALVASCALMPDRAAIGDWESRFPPIRDWIVNSTTTIDWIH